MCHTFHIHSSHCRVTKDEYGGIDTLMLQQLHDEYTTTGKIDSYIDIPVSSTEVQVHDNEPDDLPDLGEPYQLIAHAGVRIMYYGS